MGKKKEINAKLHIYLFNYIIESLDILKFIENFYEFIFTSFHPFRPFQVRHPLEALQERLLFLQQLQLR